MRIRVADEATADITGILATSDKRWGPDACSRYVDLLERAFVQIAGDPLGPLSRVPFGSTLRSLHLREVKHRDVREPSHVVFYRVRPDGSIDIVRVLHERMAPDLHIR